MIDSHCHLESAEYAHTLDAVLERMQQQGVTHAITIGCSLERAQQAVLLAQRHEPLKAAVSVHPETYGGTPQERADVDPDHVIHTLNTIIDHHEQWAQQQEMPSQIVAIGECGLDYHRPEHRATRDKQMPLFIAQLELARTRNLPVIMHIRDAFDDALHILEEYTDLCGVVHCYTDSLANAHRVLEQGWCIGFTGIITFGDARLERVVQEVPLDRLLLETDAPYLSPVPQRGQWPNEPSRVVHVAQKVADLKDVSIEEVDRATTKTTQRLFGL